MFSSYISTERSSPRFYQFFIFFHIYQRTVNITNNLSGCFIFEKTKTGVKLIPLLQTSNPASSIVFGVNISLGQEPVEAIVIVLCRSSSDELAFHLQSNSSEIIYANVSVWREQSRTNLSSQS